MPPRLSLPELNAMDRETFARALSGVVEGSPWVAERAWERRPFASVVALQEAMASIMFGATKAEQLAILQAHPDLAERAARSRPPGASSSAVGSEPLGASSGAEQAAAGLDRLSDADYERFRRLNIAYRAAFGFPFIIAVRRHTVPGILAAFERRLVRSRPDELEGALAEVAEIVRLRLQALLSAATLTTHVLDTAHGCPAEGVRLDLSTVETNGSLRRLKSMTTNGDGRTDAPVLAEGELMVAHYEIAFHVGAYFRRRGAPTTEPPFLDVVPVRFAIADPHRHYHVPLLVGPWSYTTYRGS